HDQNKVIEIKTSSMPAGISEEKAIYFDEKIVLRKDDIMILFTDGVSEMANEQGEIFGRKRIYQIIEMHSILTIEEILDKIKDALKAFQNQQKQSDDISIILAKIH
ncbi:MAG: serine/threonine-protein phosphatase, partial [Spirochaetes bacterium]|nr:serine/threonine-protein phosphatase [Spirochaetota bacterium]